MSINAPNHVASQGRWTCATNVILGGTTMLLVIKRSTDNGTAGRALNFQNGTQVNQFTLGFRTTTDLLYCSPLSTAATLNGKVADGWIAIGVGKTNGTTTPRFHKYVYETGVASHEDGDVAVVDSTAPGVGANLIIAKHQSSGAPAATCFGDYGVAAVYDRVLSDSEFETAVQSVAAMKALNPALGLWLFDHPVDQANEMFTGSSFVVQSQLTVGTTDPPIGLGYRTR